MFISMELIIFRRILNHDLQYLEMPYPAVISTARPQITHSFFVYAPFSLSTVLFLHINRVYLLE